MNKGASVMEDEFCCDFMSLPEHVLHEILFRLPIISVMHLKVACRSLYNLVSHPDFAVNYSKHSFRATYLVPVFCKGPAFDLQDFNNRPCDGEYIRTIIKPNIHLDCPLYDFHIVGTCNGVLCFSIRCGDTLTVYICNPVRTGSGESCIAVAEHKFVKGHKCIVYYGFCFCKASNNYKLVKFICTGNRYETQKGEILTIGVDDTWRGIDLGANPRPILSLLSNDNKISVNETLHWIKDDYETCSTWIYTFDFREEKTGRISHPDGLVRLDSISMYLTPINNQLCLVQMSRSYYEIIIWKMQYVDSEACWSKAMMFDVKVLPKEGLRKILLWRILENGDMHYASGRGYTTVSYSPTTREFTELDIHCSGCVDYTPNLLSLKEIMGCEQYSRTMNLLST